MDREQRAFLDNRLVEVIRESPMGEKLRQLAKTLIGISGTHVSLPVIEEDINAILTRSRAWDHPDITMRRGRACHCHGNSCDLWDANRDRLVLCTGYALSKDGIWRQHSWCWWPGQDRIAETTTKREVYYGFEMTDDEAEQFCIDNP